MNLQQALQDPGFIGLDDSAALAYGNESVTIATSAGTLWSYDGVAAQFGAAVAEGIGAAIASAGFPLAVQSYVAKGIDLSLPQVQTQLSAIATAVPSLASACTALQQIGITIGTRWQLWGVAQPLVGDITAARAALANQAAKTTLMNEIINPQASDSSVSLAQFQANIAAFTG